MTFVITAYGKTGKGWALSPEAEAMERVEECIDDLDLAVLETGYGLVIEALPTIH